MPSPPETEHAPFPSRARPSRACPRDQQAVQEFRALLHEMLSDPLGAPSSAPTDGNLNNSNISFWLDQSGHNLKVRVKYSDSTLKTATIPFD